MYEISSSATDHDRTTVEPSRSRLRSSRRLLWIVGLVVVLTVALASTPALDRSSPIGVAAGQNGPQVAFSDVTVDPGEDATSTLTLSSAPQGIAGFDLTVSVEDGTIASIADVSYPDAFSFTKSPNVSADGTTVEIAGADANENVDAGATNVLLAEITVTGESGGETSLTIAEGSVDDEDGNDLNAARQPGTIAVQGPSGGDAGNGDDGGTTTGFGPTGLGPLLAVLALVSLAGLASRLRR